MNTSESLTLLSLMVTTFSPLFLPLFDIPLLGVSDPVYQDINQSKIRAYSFVIGNYGTGSAEEVKISIGPSPYNLFNFTIHPYLSTHIKQDNNSSSSLSDRVLFEIDTVPPKLEINMTGYINSTNRDALVNPVVFTNNTVAMIGFDNYTMASIILGFMIPAILILMITLWFYWYNGKVIKPINEVAEKVFKIDHDLNITRSE